MLTEVKHVCNKGLGKMNSNAQLKTGRLIYSGLIGTWEMRQSGRGFQITMQRPPSKGHEENRRRWKTRRLGCFTDNEDKLAQEDGSRQSEYAREGDN